MGLWDKIKHTRNCGVVHRGTLEEPSLYVSAVASSFNLHPNPSIYREITPAQAQAIAVRILHHDLTYAQEIMSLAKATRLVKGFMAPFEEANLYSVLHKN